MIAVVWVKRGDTKVTSGRAPNYLRAVVRDETTDRGFRATRGSTRLHVEMSMGSEIG